MRQMSNFGQGGIPDFLKSYEAWEAAVPETIKQEGVWKFYAYRKALFLYDLCWYDCERLLKEPRGRKVSGQLIASMGSVSANIEEGYGRGLSTREYQQFLRYAVASAKESKGWYFRGRHLLPDSVVEHRLALLSEVIALLLTELKRRRREK